MREEQLKCYGKKVKTQIYYFFLFFQSDKYLQLILVCVFLRRVQMIPEAAYSSQTKLIRQSIHVWEHGIGYLNLAFEAKKGQKRSILGFKPLKRLEGLEIQS